MNTANPVPMSTYYWPASGTRDPALCSNAASTTDPGCAYDYGWHAAANALGTQAKSIPNAATMSWWLDVETGNSWNGDATSNAADLQGSVDYLRSHGVAQVGLYSTAYQWSAITAGYSTSNQSGYASAWQPEFTAQYPMTSSPVWIAGVGTSSDASAACSTTFTGSPAVLAQYADGSGYDADLSCAASTPPAPSPPTAPQNLTAAAKDSAVTLTWQAPVSTGGAPISYSVLRGTASGQASTPVASGLTGTGYTDTGLVNGSTYFYTIVASNSAGSSPASTQASATPAPTPQAFTVSLSPASGTVRRGASTTSTVVVSESGTRQTVKLVATRLPAGASVTFTPAMLTTSGSATMKVSTSSTAARGTYSLAVTAAGTSGSQTKTFALTITR